MRETGGGRTETKYHRNTKLSDANAITTLQTATKADQYTKQDENDLGVAGKSYGSKCIERSAFCLHPPKTYSCDQYAVLTTTPGAPCGIVIQNKRIEARCTMWKVA